MRKSLERRQSERGRGDGETTWQEKIRPQFSWGWGAQTAHKCAVTKQQLPHTLSTAISRLTRGTFASGNLDYTLDELSGIWNLPEWYSSLLTARIQKLFQILVVPHPGVCPVHILSQQSGRPIKAELPVYADTVFPPACQVSAKLKDLLRVWVSFCSLQGRWKESRWKVSSTVGLKLRETGNCCLLLLWPPTFNFPLYDCWRFSHRAITVHVSVKTSYSSHTFTHETYRCVHLLHHHNLLQLTFLIINWCLYLKKLIFFRIWSIHIFSCSSWNPVRNGTRHPNHAPTFKTSIYSIY